MIRHRPFPERADRAAAICACLLLAVTYAAYWPGLSGGFLFDDFSNLAVLGYYGRIDNLEALWLYLLSGFSGPTGRPLSTLSFLLDARDWPADPRAFKHTNLVIHLLVGVALYLLIRQIARALDLDRARAVRFSVLATALWLLHPFWVSTTLYVVQRMAQLSTLFVLLGLWLYLRSRLGSPRVLTGAAVVQSAAGIGLCGLMAVLSKENGALLPLLAIVLEVTVLSARERRTGEVAGRGWRLWQVVLLGVPAVFLALYMAQSLPALISGDPGTRSFTPGERLLGQGLILWDYLGHLLLPRPTPGELFNDHIRTPAGTAETFLALLAWGGLLALTAASVLYRRRHPVLALTFLFFMTGHLLESSFLRLELYFEHRNYLPAALFGLPLACFLTRPGRLPRWGRVAIASGVLVVLAALTWMRAELCGAPFQQALAWSRSAPDSPRAQHYLAQRWIETGNLEEANRLNRRAIELAPHELPWLMTQVMLDCRMTSDPSLSVARVAEKVESLRQANAVTREQLSRFLDLMLNEGCRGFTGPGPALEFIERINRTATIPGSVKVLLHQRAGVASLLLEKHDEAYEWFALSLRHTSDPGVRLRNAALLASGGAYRQALALLDMELSPAAPRGGLSVGRLRRHYVDQAEYYQRERDHLRARIVESMTAPAPDGENEQIQQGQ
jgi:protein O-mannosyl-transferase